MPTGEGSLAPWLWAARCALPCKLMGRSFPAEVRKDDVLRKAGRPARPDESSRKATGGAAFAAERRWAAPRLGEAAHPNRSNAKVSAEAAHAADAFRLPH